MVGKQENEITKCTGVPELADKWLEVMLPGTPHCSSKLILSFVVAR
jgi:hypothetical protein